MFLSCKQLLKDLSLRWGGLHNTCPARSPGLFSMRARVHRAPFSWGESSVITFWKTFYFALNCIVLGIFFSWSGGLMVRTFDQMSASRVDSITCLWRSEAADSFPAHAGYSSSPPRTTDPSCSEGGVPTSTPFSQQPQAFCHCISWWQPLCAWSIIRLLSLISPIPSPPRNPGSVHLLVFLTLFSTGKPLANIGYLWKAPSPKMSFSLKSSQVTSHLPSVLPELVAWARLLASFYLFIYSAIQYLFSQRLLYLWPFAVPC